MIKKQIPMGVINITPNSFSDGGKFLDATNIQKLVNEFESIDTNLYCLDFGAESSAPFNDALTCEQEWERIEKYFLPVLDSRIIDESIILSIDTYHTQTIRTLIPIIGKDFKVIWNDISGKVDMEMIETLKEFPQIDYVLCHNLCPSRERANYHIEYIDEEFSIKKFKEFFSQRLKAIEEHGIDLNRIILDPCFGFSKNAAQNYMLLEASDDYINLHQRWVLGVSKKSFLQLLSEGENKEQKRENSEYFHLLILVKWLKNYRDFNIFYRIHDPKIFKKAQLAQKLI